MSTPDSSTPKKKTGAKGLARDAAIFMAGAATGAFGMRTYLNQTNQIRSEAEVAAVEKNLAAKQATTATK